VGADPATHLSLQQQRRCRPACNTASLPVTRLSPTPPLAWTCCRCPPLGLTSLLGIDDLHGWAHFVVRVLSARRCCHEHTKPPSPHQGGTTLHT